MPELPEVETVMNGLRRKLINQTFSEIHINRYDLRWPIPPQLPETLRGQTLQNLSRRAKYLIFDFGNFGILGHLGMSGSLSFVEEESAIRKHDHIIFKTSEYTVAYHDPRRFGAFDLWEASPHTHKWLINLGIEPLSNQLHPEWLFQIAQTRKVALKSFLLNQHIIAGLGNIYVCESLWRAYLHPEKKANKLTYDEAEMLVQSIQDVLREAIIAGGSSLKDHKQVNGELGYFQHQFDVYNREGRACKRCKNTIERINQSGRSSFLCPKCQKA